MRLKEKFQSQPHIHITKAEAVKIGERMKKEVEGKL